MVAYIANLSGTSYGNFVTNRTGHLVYICDQLCCFLGYDKESLDAQQFCALLPENIREQSIKKHNQDFELTGEQTSTQFLQKENDCIVPVSIHTILLSGEGDGLRLNTVLPAIEVSNGIVAAGTEPSFASVLETSEKSVFFSQPDGNILFANKAACALFGYSAAEFSNVRRQGIFLPEDNLHLEKMLQQRTDKGSINCTLTARKKDGEKIVTEITSTIYQGADGQDYSTSIVTLVELSAAEQELELLVNNTEESFVLINTDLNIVRCNRQFIRLYKDYYDIDVQIGQCILRYSASTNTDKLRALYQKVLTGETINTELKIKTAKKDVIFLLKYKPAICGNGKIYGVFVSGIDITDRKELEELQQASERRYKALVENGSDGVAILTPDGIPIYTSPSVEKLLGYTKAECEQMSLFSLTHPYDKEKVMKMWAAALKYPGMPISGVTTRMLHKDGTWRWMQETITNMLQEPAINGLIDNFRDVTELVNAHEDLLQKQFHIELAETNYREIFEKANDGILIYNLEDGCLTELNQRAIELIGCTREQILQSPRKRFEADVPGFSLAIAMDKFKEAVAGTAQVFEWLIKRWDGSYGWMEVSLKRATIAGSDKVLAFFRAIDKRKAVEEEMQKLSRIARETNNSVVITDELGKIQWVNEAFERITEYNKSEVIGLRPADFLYGAETSEVAKRYMQIKNVTRQPFTCDLVNYSKDGRKYWIRMESQPRINKEGKLVGFFALQTDITAEKEAQDFVKSSEEKYRSLFDFNPSCIVIWDPATLKVLEVNNKTVEVYGYSKEEFQNLTMLNFRPESSYEHIQTVAKDFINRTRSGFKGLLEHYNKSGEIMPMSYESRAITYGGNIAVLAMGENIKEKIRMERELESERTKRQFEITAAVLSTQEKERKEIGEELHDNVNQILAGAMLYLGLSRKEIDKDVPFMNEAEKLLDAAIFELRNISHALIPPRLPEHSLEDSLENVIKLSEHSGIKIYTEFVNIEGSAISANLKLTIYRIVQEHFNNILKHARATIIHLSVVNDNNVVKLVIKDNGIGFDTSQKTKGVGLINIRARASLYNSRVSIHSSPANGCELSICFKAGYFAGENTGA